MITLYDRYERNFATNGLGILEITQGVVEEELNGIFKFAGTYPLGERLSDKVTVGATLRVDTPLGQEPFRIWSINKTDGNIQIVAYHITFDLYYKIVEDKNLVNMNGQAALTSLLNGTGFTAISDVATVASARVVRKSIQQAIFGDDDNSFLPRWGGEFLRTGFTLNAKNFRGRTFAQNPVAIRYGKNLVSYETEIDESAYYNRIMPVGFNGLLLPEKYVNRVGIDLNDIRVQIVEYNNIKAIEDPANPREGELPLAQAEQALRDLVSADFTAGKFDPKVNHKIEFVDLSNTVEYENKSVLEKRYLGDEVRILNEDLLDVTARVISYQYDPITNEYISMELGNFQDKPMEILNRLDLISKTVDELSTRQLTEQYVTDLLTSALGGYVKELNGEMFVTNNINPELATKVWRWNINGLGYSGTGINGPYTAAITMDGTILGSFIAAHTINTNQISNDASIRLVANSLVTIDENGITTGIVSSSMVSRQSYDGFRVLDGADANKTIISVTDGGVDGPVIKATQIYSPSIIRRFSGSKTIYVSGSGVTGDGTGRDASNKADNVSQAIQTALDGAKQFDDGTLTVILDGAVTEYVLLFGYTGNGTITIQGGRINGYVDVKNTSIRVDIKTLIARVDGSTQGLISATNCPDVRVDASQLDGAGVGYGVAAYYGSSIYVTNTDIVKCVNAYRAVINSTITQVGCKGTGNTVVAYASYGSEVNMTGTRPIGTSVASQVGEGRVYSASSTELTSAFSVSPAIWGVKSATFTCDLSRENVTDNWTTTGKFAQGKSLTSGTAYKGFAKLGSKIKDWLTSNGGYQNLQAPVITATRDSLWGFGDVALKFTDGYILTLPAVGKGLSSSAVAGASLASYLETGTAVSLNTTTLATADYAGYSKITVKVTADKKV